MNNKNINIGIQLLRFVLCFWIVIIHCTHIKGAYKPYLFKGFHVPTFILIAFYFYYPLLYNRAINKIISRFQRLLISYILWPIIILIFHNISIKTFPIFQYNKTLSLKDLYLQLLIGTPFHRVFWFQFNLIFLSILFVIISFIFKNNFLVLYQLLAVLSLYLIISQNAYKYLICFTKNIIENIFGLINLMPLAVIGCILCSMNLISKLKSVSISFYLIQISLFILFFKYDIFIHLKGYRYPNVLLNIIVSIILLLLFGSLQFDKPKNITTKNIYQIILYITNYTGGIYYIHTNIRDFLLNKVIYFKKETYLSSSIIYIFCYFLCFIGYNSFRKNILKYLFI